MSTAPRFEPRYTVDDYVVVDPDDGTVGLLEAVDRGGRSEWLPRPADGSTELAICDRCRVKVPLGGLARRPN